MTPELCIITEPDIIIPDGADVLWAGPRNIRSNVIVESGGKLTITCDIGMPTNGRITVEPNAQLIIDGARIYNNCAGEFWDGIVVVGDSDAHQIKLGGVNAQGYVGINPGSVIEGAYIGVRLFDPAKPQQTAGGIIFARSATFLNNKGGVAFARYKGYNPFTGGPLGYSASFTGCRFIVDGNIGLGLPSFSYMANLLGVDGVRFLGCTFANDYPIVQGAYADYRGYGILAYDAGFSIEGQCLGSTYPCQSYQKSILRGFQTGIYAQNTGKTTNTFRVSRADFDDNARGIVSNGVHNIYAVLNNFKVGMNIPYQYSTNPFVGIQVFRGTGFTIEENDLEPTTLVLPTGIEAVGINIVASGEEANEVYKNNLDGLYVGNLANGKNRNSTNPILGKGLQYLCNTHTVNDFDIAVPSKSWSPGTIAGNQGSLSRAAGNSFTGMPVEQEGHILNEIAPLTYFFSSGLEPVNITPLLVNTTQATQAHGCASNLLGNKDGIISATEKQQIEGYFNGTADQSEKSRAANILIRQGLVDTNGIDLPYVRTWLSNKGGLEASFMTVDTWLHEGNTSAAQQTLASIPNNFTLSGEPLTEYQLFNQYKNIQIAAVDNGQDDAQMLAANQSTIATIAGAGDYYASTQAKSLINLVHGITYEPYIILPDPTPPQLLAPPSGGTSSATPFVEGAYLEAMPNPAKGQTVFSYRLPEGATTGNIAITGLGGLTIQRFGLTEAIGNLTWDTANVPAGIYLFSLDVDGKSILTQRLSIIH